MPLKLGIGYSKNPLDQQGVNDEVLKRAEERHGLLAMINKKRKAGLDIYYAILPNAQGKVEANAPQGRPRAE